MANQENLNMGRMNTPVYPSPSYGMANSGHQTEAQPFMSQSMTYQTVYPEIYYKIHPFIMMVCDQIDAYGYVMPTQETVEQMTDNIYNDICKMYPDLAQYTNSSTAAYAKNDPPDPPFFDNMGFRPRFRRRGPLRDIIEILILSELFRRRRRNY